MDLSTARSYEFALMWRPHPTLLLLALLWPGTAVHAQAPVGKAPVYSLTALVDRAVTSSPSIAAAKHKIRAARAQLTESKVSPFSQFSATGGVALAPTVRGTALFTPETNALGIRSAGDNSTTVGLSADVTGTIPLYTWGKLRGAWDAAEQGVDAAENDRDRVLAQLRYDVRRAYYALQFSLDVLSLIDEGRSKLDNAVSKIEERIEAGDPDADEQDRWRMSSTLAEIDAQSAQAYHLEASSRAALALLAGLPRIDVPECPLAPAQYTLDEVDRYRAQASTARPDLRMLDSAVRGRRAATKIASSSYFPDLGLVLRGGRTYTPGRTDQSNPFVRDDANGGSLGAALGFRWNLDLWGNYLRVERAEAELDQTRSLREAARIGVAIEVTNTVENVRDAQRQETAWARGEKDTRAWFLSAVQAYQVGTNEPRDLVDAVKAYFKARVAHLEAVRQLNTSLAELERVTGAPVLADPRQWEVGCTEE